MNENKEKILEKRLSILFMIIFIKFQKTCEVEDVLKGISPDYLRNKWEGILNTDYENLERILHPAIRESNFFEKGFYGSYKKLWGIE